MRRKIKHLGLHKRKSIPISSKRFSNYKISTNLNVFSAKRVDALGFGVEIVPLRDFSEKNN